MTICKADKARNCGELASFFKLLEFLEMLSYPGYIILGLFVNLFATSKQDASDHQVAITMSQLQRL